MIDKQMARDLLPLVHNELYTELLKYVAYRKNRLKDATMVAVDVEAIRNMQGAYSELSLLEDLKKWVETDSKDA